MKKLLLTLTIVFLVLGMLSFFPEISAENGQGNGNPILSAGNGSEDNENGTEVEIGGEKKKVYSKGMNASQIKETIRERNRLQFENKTNVTCPDDCFCRGVVMSCEMEDETKQMTVYAQSGNIIVINTGGINTSTNVTLYHHDGRIFGIFSNGTEKNQAKEIKVLPDEAKERVRERTRARLNNTNITLNENGEYEYQAEKQARFLGLFKVKEKVKWHIDSETGEILKQKVPWWGFLANDIEEESE